MPGPLALAQGGQLGTLTQQLRLRAVWYLWVLAGPPHAHAEAIAPVCHS